MKTILKAFLRFVLVFALIQTIVRIIRHLYKFPMPQAMANFIDNPLRRRFQPPDEMPLRHDLRPGQTVLEVGPGNGRYTLAAARRLGAEGKLIAIDIEPKMIERVQSRIQAEGVTNVQARVANVHALPFEDATFDAIYLITVIGEIPRPELAMAQFFRVLRPGGTLAFSELLPDPDYPLASTLIRRANSAGFTLKRKTGSFFCYSLVFQKPLPLTVPGA